MSRRSCTAARGVGAAAVLVSWLLASAATAQPGEPATGVQAPASATTSADGTTTFVVENMTRAELWRYFEPFPGTGSQPDYTFIGNRSTLGVAYDGHRWGLRGTLQYVRLENLPTGAIGPGLLGTGAAYFFQAAGTFSYQFYLRELSLAWRSAGRGAWLEAGRVSRVAAIEASSGDTAIDALTASELNGRLLGDTEWSFYQRAWDGVRGGVTRGPWRVTATAAMPTQGTFEESANLTMDRVRVVELEARVAPGGLVPHTDLRLFATAYDDTRGVTVRPDNSNRRVTRADVQVQTIGTSAVGAWPWRFGTADAVGWLAIQTGSWWEQRHRAWAGTASLGQRWTRLPGRPRLRLGLTYASGDGDPRDGTHGTLFPMLPSGDRVSGLNAYALMNVVDQWISLDASPSSWMDVKVAARRVRLASPDDRWYYGSGATARTGNFFGFLGRTGGGASSLGTVVEAGATWRPVRWWTLRGYAGRMAGGDVVSGLFSGSRLVTAWLESTVRF
jgi:Alginate export